MHVLPKAQRRVERERVELHKLDGENEVHDSATDPVAFLELHLRSHGLSRAWRRKSEAPAKVQVIR